MMLRFLVKNSRAPQRCGIGLTKPSYLPCMPLNGPAVWSRCGLEVVAHADNNRTKAPIHAGPQA
jgi:hypothetical protein